MGAIMERAVCSCGSPHTHGPHAPWVVDSDLPRIAACQVHRLTPLMARMGGCRFTAPARDVARIVAALERDGDYCRDVSVPCA